MGLSLRNGGFIDDESDLIRKKARTYNLGLPLAVKAGHPDGKYVYAGSEMEFPYNYKEKTFVGGEKRDKFNYWFNRPVNPIRHTVFAGVRLPQGASLRFKYYHTPFFNERFVTLNAQGQRERPYDQFTVHQFYFSLVKMITKDKHLRVWESCMTCRRVTPASLLPPSQPTIAAQTPPGAGRCGARSCSG